MGILPCIAVVDYRMGNLKSVERGLDAAGAQAFITERADDIRRADAVVLPGVGAFADAARNMSGLGQMDAIRDAVAEGRPFLGICLGMHLLFSDGLEGAAEGQTVKGLGLIQGTVTRMPREDGHGRRYKVPHVGWNSIEAPLGMGMNGRAALRCACNMPDTPTVPDTVSGAARLFAGIPQGEYFYFTHSYIAPDTPATVAETVHSIRFPSAVALTDRVFGLQFHPEKSSDAGAKVLANFVEIVASTVHR
ncbi:MAG: imidazole glycerol phosphate synthase subunit HisH [Eggerthellaceae bacterium]|jgi:glutamine amidotransferase